MYETFSALAGRLGAPYARKLAVASIRMAGAFESAPPPPGLRRTVMGLSFPSPVGLAAGFDKRGTLYPALSGLGFGFAEIGSVIPRPEPGRSPGLAAVMQRLECYRAPHPIPLGVSISMNRATPLKQIPLDYLDCLQRLWRHADYITLNLGVRAGPDLHLPENRSMLHAVFSAIKRERWGLASMDGRRVPIAVKIDQGRGNTADLIDCARDYGFDGLILSGEGKGDKSAKLAALERFAHALRDEMPIISVGGIRTAQDAQDRLNAGATLLQVYTGMVQSGPGLVKSINGQLLANGVGYR
jgi:dihydroorotate dehydrogenase